MKLALYSAILTNDWDMDVNEIVFFYNQRGTIEKEFDVLKNDFGWNNLPFSKVRTKYCIYDFYCDL